MKKKILGVFEPAFVPRGGSENHTLELFNLLSSDYKFEIISLDNDSNEVTTYLNTLGIDYFYDGKKVIYFHKNVKITILFYKELNSTLDLLEKFIQNYNPELFYGFFLREICIEVFNRFNIPVIYFAHTAEKNIKPCLFNYAIRQKYLYVVSEFMQDFFYTNWGIKPLLFTEFFEQNYYLTETNPEKKYLTMINHLPSKGLYVFLDLAEALPKQQFLLVGGWKLPDPKLIEFIKNSPNITYIPPVVDMRKIYSETKILLFPSFYSEAFGRCLMEVAINKIPLIASKVGAIPKVLGNYEGCLPYPKELRLGVLDTSEWKLKIGEILNNYPEYSEKVYEVWLQHERLLQQKLSDFRTLIDSL